MNSLTSSACRDLALCCFGLRFGGGQHRRRILVGSAGIRTLNIVTGEGADTSF
jgi:hypothetical protein